MLFLGTHACGCLDYRLMHTFHPVLLCPCNIHYIYMCVCVCVGVCVWKYVCSLRYLKRILKTVFIRDGACIQSCIYDPTLTTKSVSRNYEAFASESKNLCTNVYVTNWKTKYSTLLQRVIQLTTTLYTFTTLTLYSVNSFYQH